MPAFQIVVDRLPQRSSASRRASAGRGVVDLLVDGTNLTARLDDAEVAPLLRDLAFAIVDLAKVRRTRSSLRFLGAEGAWELGVERSGRTALLSIYRGGPIPEIAVFERKVEGDELVRGTLEAIAGSLSGPLSDAMAAELTLARDALASVAWPDGPAEVVPIAMNVDPEGDAPVRFGAEIALRPEDDADLDLDSDVERSDLFALLFRGTIRVGVGDRSRDLGDTHVFLLAEQLAVMAGDVLDAWEQGRSFYRRNESGGVVVAMRLSANAADPDVQSEREESGTAGEIGLWLTVGGPRTAGLRNAWTFPSVDVPAMVQAVIGFGRSLIRALIRRSPAQLRNLRVSALRQTVRDLDERLCDAVRDDAKVNASPESYRAYAALAKRAAPAQAPWGRAKIRFAPRWTATVAGIDLRATFLCGDRIIVGAARETSCLDRTTGTVLWRQAMARAVSVVTPGGLARLAGDGAISVHDFGTGEITLKTRVAPRVGGLTSGAVVSSPGLPRLLVVTEGERHLSAVDLSSGEVRWRHLARRGDSFRLRRAGKLLILASGDPSLTALDVQSGEVVWRVKDRLRFSAPVTLDHDSLFAIAGDLGAASRGSIRLHHLDPYAGTTRWACELPPRVVPTGAPLATDEVVIVVTRDRRGLGLVAFDRATGAVAWTLEPGYAPVGSAWLVVDDVLVHNAETGVLAALSTKTGTTLWRHAFDRAVDGDQPRKLEPILRSGALFVPQHEVNVVRPRDGEILGRVPTDLIPDLLRVDERCDVYVAEESGHLAAFAAGARLSLV